jgi:hypothetical protein
MLLEQRLQGKEDVLALAVLIIPERIELTLRGVQIALDVLKHPDDF